GEADPTDGTGGNRGHQAQRRRIPGAVAARLSLRPPGRAGLGAAGAEQPAPGSAVHMSVHVSADGAVGTLTLDAPPLNLLSDALRAALLDALADFRDEAKLTAEQVQAFLDADEAVFGALAEFPGATIAAVHGYAYGGGFELALACDIRVAGRAARFAGVGVKLGLTVSTARLARVAGEGVALDLLLTG